MTTVDTVTRLHRQTIPSNRDLQHSDYFERTTVEEFRQTVAATSPSTRKNPAGNSPANRTGQHPYSSPAQTPVAHNPNKHAGELPKLEMVKIRIVGSWDRNRFPASSGGILNLPSDTKLVDLGEGHFRAFGREISKTWIDSSTTPIQVTNGRPCYDGARGYKINSRQTIASFFSRVFPNPVEAKIDAPLVNGVRQPFTGGSSSNIIIGQNGKTSMRLSFHRTVRIPEDGASYNLPPGLGRFPLFDVRPFSHKLPVSVVSKGGIFLPIYSMISFTTQ